MNDILTELRFKYIPKAALIAYQHEDTEEYLLELRKIHPSGKMGAAKPVTYDFMNALVAGFSEEFSGTPFGKIPHNLLYCDTRKGFEKYIWYNQPQQRMMYFASSLNIENGLYNVPGLIYCASKENLNIYSYKGELYQNAELYAAPFFNVSGSNVCMGSATMKKPDNPSYNDILIYWEKKFWSSVFTHLGSLRNPTKSNLVLVTKAAQNSEFNYDELKPLKMKVKDILK